jgi:acyl carrier protein
MTEEILDFINDQLLGGLEIGSITVNDDLLGTGWIDSIGMMSLIAFIENRFEIKIPPQEMTIENFKTVNDISTYLKRHLAAG